MRRLLWVLALIVTFSLGFATAEFALRAPSATPGRDELRETADRLQQQVATLQARLHAREGLALSRPSGPTASSGGSGVGAPPATNRLLVSTATEQRGSSDNPAPGGGGGGLPGDRAPARPEPRTILAPPPTIEAALERFYQYLEATNGTEGRGGWQRARELVDELRGMGDVGAHALMQVLASGSDSDERRAAARLLGRLQVPEALPLLQSILEKDQDLLLRRAAAAGLRQLQTPDSMPLMERILRQPAEDRFVRLSAAQGLAESGRPLGVTGLTQIFHEAGADGRGREMAFRALTSLNDERPLPFMRQIVTSESEPGYRLRAIRYLTAQGDRQALPALQALMQSTNEQPSIRDAAAQAYRALGGSQ